MYYFTLALQNIIKKYRIITFQVMVTITHCFFKLINSNELLLWGNGSYTQNAAKRQWGQSSSPAAC